MRSRARIKNKGRQVRRERRHRRIRKRIQGSAERPRLVVFRSLKHIEGQVVDDEQRHTLVGLASRGSVLADFKPEEGPLGIARAKETGKRLAEKAVAAGVTKVVFDRAGYQYHGQVRAFAEGAREGGLDF